MWIHQRLDLICSHDQRECTDRAVYFRECTKGVVGFSELSMKNEFDTFGSKQSGHSQINQFLFLNCL